jgi:hypothetical protein
MKLIPVVATLVVGSFAILGFAAGTLVASHDTAPDNGARLDLARSDVLTLPAEQADAILNAAEATTARQGPTAPVSQPSPAQKPAPHVVKMGNVTQPVRKAASVSFVVADLAVAVRDADSAAHYEIPQNAARLQAAIVTAMASAAETAVLRGVSIDSRILSGQLTTELQQSFADVEDVLFLTLYKHDVGYN